MSFKPQLNPNITSLKESATLAINLQAKAARAQGKDVVHFGFGQSPFPVHKSIQQALIDNAHQKDYLPTKGLPDLCKAVVKWHKDIFDYDLHLDGVMVGPGSKEMIFQALFCLEGPVLVPAPSWVSYGPQVNIRGKIIEAIKTKRDNSYKLTAAELEAACKKFPGQQKNLILNNPANPTGALYHDDEIQALVKVCREQNVIVISDEIYSLVNFTDSTYVGFHKYYPEGTIITAGLSKSHGAGGYRLGILAAPENFSELTKALCAMISETFSSVSAPIQYAALAAYTKTDELMEHIALCTRVHSAAGDYLHKRFVKMGLNCPKPEGAFYLFPDFENFKEKLKNKGINTCSELSQKLFDDELIAVLPGSDFYLDEDYFGVRIASVDYEGGAVLDASLSVSLLDKSFIEKHCSRLKLGCDRLEIFLNKL
jgi:aspartate aminotransferase